MKLQVAIVSSDWPNELEEMLNSKMDDLLSQGHLISTPTIRAVPEPRSMGQGAYMAIINYWTGVELPSSEVKATESAEGDQESEDFKDPYTRGFMDGVYAALQNHERLGAE